MIQEDGFEFLDILRDIDEQHLERILNPKEQKSTYPVIYHPGRKIACVILIVILGLCGIFYKQVEAAARKIITYIADILEISEDITPYTEIIGTSIEKDGITVSLEEVIVTPKTIVVAVRVEGPEAEYCVGNGDIIINQTEQMSDAVSGSRDSNNSIYIDKYIFNDELSYLENNDILVGVNIYKSLDDICAAEPLSFVFEFNISKADIYTQDVIIELDETIRIDEKADVKITSYKNDVFCSYISLKVDQDVRNVFPKDNEYYIFAEDNQGNNIFYSVGQRNDYTITFRCDEYLPLDIEWMDVQLFSYKPVYYDIGDSGDSEYGEQESEVFGIDSADMMPMGEKVRIYLTE